MPFLFWEAVNLEDNWIIESLKWTFEMWNDKQAEIWELVSTTPQEFKNGEIWEVIKSINGALQAIGLALLVVFFLIGIIKTCRKFYRSKETRTSD